MRVWFLFALLGAASGDLDRDTIEDAEEQRLLEQFAPKLNIAVGDCDVKPAEFESGRLEPVVKERNGTIYGQAFRVEGGIELHFYHLWGTDCGRVKHALDAEHVSALLVWEKQEWRARYWYAAAHEDTVCDRGSAARASLLYAEWRGPEIWISRGKHASFLSDAACRLGCGSDKCDRSERLVVEQVLNLGERGQWLHGGPWVESAGWPLKEKMGSDFPLELRAQLDEARGIMAAGPRNPAVQPVILAGSSTIDALEQANTKTGNALVQAKQKVKEWFEKKRRR